MNPGITSPPTKKEEGSVRRVQSLEGGNKTELRSRWDVGMPAGTSNAVIPQATVALRDENAAPPTMEVEMVQHVSHTLGSFSFTIEHIYLFVIISSLSIATFYIFTAIICSSTAIILPFVCQYGFEPEDTMMLDSDDDNLSKQSSWSSMHAPLRPISKHSTSRPTVPFSSTSTSAYAPPARRNSASQTASLPPPGPLPDDLYGLAWTVLLYTTRHLPFSLTYHLSRAHGSSWPDQLGPGTPRPPWTLAQQLDLLHKEFTAVFELSAYGGYHRARQHVAGMLEFVRRWDHAGRYRDKYGEETGRVLQMVEVSRGHVAGLVEDAEIVLHGLVSEVELGGVQLGMEGERGTREEARQKCAEWRTWLERLPK